MSAAVSGCCERMQSILMLYLNWHGLLYWELLLSQREPGDFWGTWLSNQAADCPVKGALSTSFAFSTEKFFSVFFIFGEPTYLLQLQSQIFKLSVMWSKFPLQFLSIKSEWSEIPQWYVSWLESAHETNSFLFTGKKKNNQPTRNPKGRVSATSTSVNYWLVLLTCSCTFIHIIYFCLSKA